ncbi:MAG: hypothetical protein JWM16_5984, partial [Verrucomicrobiales bacterium]|nr:hypothetical protein [Verrucomicrobiales bacterium]
MTLPKTLIAALALFLANCGRTADDGGRDWTAQIQVFDEALDPIAGADVTVGFYVTPNPGEATGVDRITGKTNEKGVFNASHRDRSFDITIAASKVGYYKSRKKHELGHPLQADQDKLHPIITLTLRTNLHPIPMYAKKIFNGPPVFNEEVGYDLVVGDWVAPHGKGK